MSKLLLFDFECQHCTYVFDDMVKPNIHEAPCPKCGHNATRLVSTPRIDPRLGLDAAGFPTMGDRWAKVREQRKAVEERRERDHGPDSWGASGADVVR
jgi:putative FmdB family regulatory protein